MLNGSANSGRLSKQDFIWKLDGFLDIVKDNYNFLWEGDPSIIYKYSSKVVLFPVDSSRQLYLDEFLIPKVEEEGFRSIGIIRKNNEFNFYLECSKSYAAPVICNTMQAYCLLEKQCDIRAKYYLDKWATSLCNELEHIIRMKMVDEFNELRK